MPACIVYILKYATLVCVSKSYLTQSTSTFFCRRNKRKVTSGGPARHSLLADLKTLAYMSTDSVNIDCIVRMCPTLSCRYLYLWAGGTRKHLLTVDNEGIWRAGARNSSMHAGADDNKYALSRESTWARCDSGQQAHWILPQPCFTQSHYLQKVECL